MKFQSFKLLIIICFWAVMNACTSNKQDIGVTPEIEKESIEKIRKVLAEESEWVKVHAAEFLIWSGNSEGVKDVYLKEEKLFDTKPQYRIGIWRVLAQASTNAEEKKVWTDKIMQVFIDTTATDRLHAVETLAKLGISPINVDEKITRAAMESDTKSLAFYTRWSTAYTSIDWQVRTQKEFLDMLVEGIEDGAAERQASYILRQFGRLSEPDWKRYVKFIFNKPKGDEPNVNLLSAAFTTVPEGLVNSEEFKQVRSKLLELANSSKGERYELSMALSINGNEQDVPVLLSLLRSKNPLVTPIEDADVAAAAGYALLKLAQK